MTTRLWLAVFLAQLPAAAGWSLPRPSATAWIRSNVSLGGRFSKLPPTTAATATDNHVVASSSSPPPPPPPPPPPRLVVLIPAYNEEERIISTLETYQEILLQNHAHLDPEILVIDDGSQDTTVAAVQTFRAISSSNKIPVRCVSLDKNRGKGAALVRGIEILVENYGRSLDTKQDWVFNDTSLPRGCVILTQDADGSGDLIYLDKMMNMLTNTLLQLQRQKNNPVSSEPSNNNCTSNVIWSPPVMVMGNRNYKFLSKRGFTRWGFQTVVRWIMNDLGVQDSQCGYKLMTLSAAQHLFHNLHLWGWSHDVEVLYRAKRLGIPILQTSIDWEDQDGSKVVASGVAKVSLQMLWDVLRLRWNYSIARRWRLDDDDDVEGRW